MDLWKDGEVFKGLISATSENLGTPAFVVEKDFYLMEILRRIAHSHPDIVFKGGTSLSKAYGAIKRFSEDLDLSVLLPADFKEEKATRERYEALLLSPLLEALKSMSFAGEAEYQEGSSPKYYCVYQKLDRALFSGGASIDARIKVESTLLSKPYPTEKKTIRSYILSYLESIGRRDIAERYNLQAFEVRVQAIERTAIDKMCALCDYYLEKKPRRNSRHIYDLYQISQRIDFANPSFRDFAHQVYQERKGLERAYSANDGVSMNALFRAMRKNGFYEKDYREVTNALVFSGGMVPYEKAIAVLDDIVRLGIFD